MFDIFERVDYWNINFEHWKIFTQTTFRMSVSFFVSIYASMTWYPPDCEYVGFPDF